MSSVDERGFRGGFRQSMAWLHTWTGLLVGWLLFAIFLTGTLSFYRDEISVWMQPELHASRADAHTPQRALDQLAILAPAASSWSVDLPGERNPGVRLSWRDLDAPSGRRGTSRAWMDAGSGALLSVRETRGGDFLYRFHFELYALERGVARWIVGFATMFMLIAIVTGVVTHKKIFKDFFTFRPGKGQRSWLDAHNATAVLALPFHFMITYSGLLLLMYQLMPWGIQAVYPQEGVRGYVSELRGSRGAGQPEIAIDEGADGSYALAPVTPMLAYAANLWPGVPVSRISVERPHGPAPVVELRAAWGHSIFNRGATESLRFSGRDGQLLSHEEPENTDVVRGLYNSFTALHLLRFAGPWLRGLFFVAGLMGTIMVASGLLLWVSKREPQRKKLGSTPRGHRLVEVLNVAAVSGMVMAIAGYFWANRMLGVELTARSLWEIRLFFIVWLLALLHAALRSYRRPWLEQWTICAVMYAALPLSYLPYWFANGLPAWPVVAVAMVLLCSAMVSALVARKLSRPALASHRRSKRVTRARALEQQA